VPAITASDGTSIRVEIHGKGEPLVLIPGLGASARVWGSFPKAMGAHFRTVAFDPRGFGGSPADPAGISMDSMVSDLLAILDGLGLDRAHLFGVSMGGIVAQVFAARHPDRVRRLVLVSTTGNMSAWSLRMLDLFDLLVRRLEPEEFVRVMAPLSLSPATFESRPGRVPEFESALLPTAEEMGRIPAQIEAIRSLAGSSPARGIRAPALILSGKRDFLTPPENAGELRRLLPDAEFKALAGGHAFLMENIDEGILHILGFLRP